MEKIQSSTAATLDRMAVLQQRYRQHKEAMNSDNSSDKSRRTSTTSTIDSTVSPATFRASLKCIIVSCSLKSFPVVNRPPLPPQNANHNHSQWENVVQRTDSFSSVSNVSQCYSNNSNHHQKPFVDQAQASGMQPIRRPVPLPGNVQTQPARNMSSSVFNLNQGGYPQPGFQQSNPWGMNTMNQVRGMLI